MAVELESKVMEEIGLGQNYRWFNGSGSCRYIRNNAIDKLVSVAQQNGLTISPSWLSHCRTANQIDNFGSSEYGLTNVWIACSYAIADAISRLESGESAGYSPEKNPRWHFTRDEDRTKWNEFHSSRFRMGLKR